MKSQWTKGSAISVAASICLASTLCAQGTKTANITPPPNSQATMSQASPATPPSAQASAMPPTPSAPSAIPPSSLPSTNDAEVSYLDTQPMGNSSENITIYNNTPIAIQVPEQDILELEAVGIGVAPTDCSPAQAVALAKRAAIIDAYRHLGEQMYGIKINANDTVQNMVLKNSSVKTKLNAIIRGASVRESACEQGVCQVTMELKLDGRVWSKVLASLGNP